MFFIMGITDGRKDFDVNQLIICDVCGKYGRFKVFMTYTVLSLFFIPTFKWNKKFFVQTSCCNALYELDYGIGSAIARGENVEIRPEHLTRVGYQSFYRKRCEYCGFETDEDFAFCPRCGNRL
ncbi:MAG: zinc ribbon domain-containing protein [Lachnospiraceae bacterium]|nr:zinc ribbon domain-containing protein [Lachnospiraceae bacterium]